MVITSWLSLLLTWHNVTHYQTLMAGMRTAIRAGRLDAHAADLRAAWSVPKENA